MSNCTQIVSTKTTQRWQCTHCSQKSVADSQDNQIAPVLDKKSHGVHQYKLCILQWNANSIHREQLLLEDILEATNVDVVCIQETKLQPKDKPPELRSVSAVPRDRPMQGGGESGPYGLRPKTDSLQNQPPTFQQFKRNREADD